MKPFSYGERLTRGAALARAGAPAASGESGGDPVVVLPGAVLLFLACDGASRFASRTAFKWAAYPPPVLIDARKTGRAIALFVRPPGADEYVALGTQVRLASWGTSTNGVHAQLELQPPLSPELVTTFGSPPPAPTSPLVGAPLAAAIAAARDTASRLALARRFYESWHAPVIPAPLDLGAVPPAVRDWHSLWNGIAAIDRGLLGCQPASWGRQGDFWIFQSENQGVVYWAVAERDRTLDDPPAVCLDDQYRPLASNASVSELGLQLIVLLTTYGGTGVSSWAHLDANQVARACTRITPLSLPPWAWPAPTTRLYTHADGVVCISGDAGAELAMVARDEERFFAASGDIGIDAEQWDVVSYA